MDMPQGIDSKFRFILVAAKRLVPIELPEVEPENNGHKKPRAGK